MAHQFNHEHFMELALEQASNAQLIARPNPAVGRVSLKQNQAIGKGFTQEAVGPHAEVMAI